jgi:tetratricopeptide (TPR) repeat protein
MRSASTLLFLAWTLSAAAQGPSLKDARQRWLRGNYEEAITAYESLAKDAKTKVSATLGMSRACRSLGHYDKALAVIDEILKDNADNADLLARRAELLYFRGHWDEAEKASEKALATNKEHFTARWVRAQIYRDRGDLKKADSEFRWFVRTYTDRSNADKDIKDPDELLLVGLAGCENARWNKLADQFGFILTDVWGDARKIEKNFWPAEYESAMLLLEKYNRGEGMPALDNALTINPNAAEALVGKGIAALQKMEIKEAEQFAERALSINPNLPDALQLRADVCLASSDAAGALKELERARQVNPRDETTLGRIAACLLFQQKKADFDALAKEVAAHDTTPGVFHAILAERLEERRWYGLAEEHYKKAAELRPMLPQSQIGLGLLWMRLGREKDARELLTKAFAADPFNVRVSNTLKVLRHLEKYETLTTDHFELRFDPKNDRALANYMAGYLEDLYKNLAGQFHYEAKDHILIEVFNNHEMFSGRTVALPDLHTIGACTGKMIAMCSPNGKGIRKPFNWGRVLRHELVHIINLEQTNYLVPHWLTEGLAVVNEGYPRPQPWNQLLLERVPKGDLMTLDSIDLGFIRPRSPLDWHMAYCQSQLYIQYMKENFGPNAVADMLNAYRDGLETSAAIRKVCKVDKETFEKGYREHLDGVVKSLKGKPAEKALSFAELKAAHQKDPDNDDITAKLAEQFLRRDRIEARKLADGVLAKKPNQPLASYVKAHLLLLSGDAAGAKALLEGALDRNEPEMKVLKELGKLAYDGGDFAKAAEIFELGRQAQPYESQWLLDLSRVHAQTGDKEKQIAVLKELVPTDADDLEHRKRLAKLLLDAGKNDEAEQYARQCLEIDIRDKETRELLDKALKGQNKAEEAARLQALWKDEKNSGPDAQEPLRKSVRDR